MSRASGPKGQTWILPALIFLSILIHFRDFNSWFRADDFSWMGLALTIHNTRDLLHALFAPMAEGTIRPLSERIFFAAGYALFGLNAVPFRLVIFATYCADLALIVSIGRRVFGSWAGECAAVLWIFNSTSVLPLGWMAAYNQVLCAFFLLLAFHFLLRWIETGRRRYNILQWLAFLLGFGAMELNLVYPALAAGYTFLCARKHFRRTLPLFVPSIAYFVIHRVFAAGDNNPEYAMHFSGSMLRTLATYWTWSIGPVFSWTPVSVPKWLIVAVVAVITLQLLAFSVERGRSRLAAFCVAWFVIAIAPVLPLRDHMMEYYPFIPVIGLCWLGGWAISSSSRLTSAVFLGGLYALMVLPRTVSASEWNHDLTGRVRVLVEGVARAGREHPGKSVMVQGVDNTLFWNVFIDHANRLAGVNKLYLAPGSEKQIEPHPDLGDIREFLLPAGVAMPAIGRGEVVVYDAAAGMREITSQYRAEPGEAALPQRVDVADTLAAQQLGPEWYPLDGNHRWMPKRAAVELAGPSTAAQKLILSGYYPEGPLRAGPVSVTVTVDGSLLPAQPVQSPGGFELSFALPASTIGKPKMQVVIEVSRTFRTPPDIRDLGLAFGTIEIR